MFDGVDPAVLPFFVGQETWPAFADRLRPHLCRMADASGGRCHVGDIIDAIITGRNQVWLALEGSEILCAMLTEIHQYPRLRAMRCIGVVGHQPRRWLHLLANVEEAARRNFGCHIMEALHQPGHLRLLATGGWAPFHVLSEKAL